MPKAEETRTPASAPEYSTFRHSGKQVHEPRQETPP